MIKSAKSIGVEMSAIRGDNT